jgi:hypothetical protein
MHNHLKKRVILAVICALCLSLAAPVWAQDPFVRQADGGAMTADLLLGRPLGIVSSLVGTAVWIVALPFTIPSQSYEQAVDPLMQRPVDYTFKRPLGEF